MAPKLLIIIKEYFTNSTLHGLRYIAEDGRHISERIFWIMLCLLSWFGSGYLILASWEAFQTNAISFVVETTYLEANSSFPSISVCEEDNMHRVYEVAQEMFGVDHDCNLDEVIKEIAYFRGTAYYIKEFCFSDDIKCPSNKYKEIADKVRSPCEDIFIGCKWRGRPFDCCKHFVKTETELGECFTLTPRNEKPGADDYIYMFSNRKIGPASLFLEFNISSKVYMHPEVDLPFYNTMTTDVLLTTMNIQKRYGISIKDIENEPEVRQLSVKQRGCRFAEENYLKVADAYSYSSCVVDCRRNEQLRLCGCTSHLMPKTTPDQWCDMPGILCLNNRYSNLSVQKTAWGQREGLICDCLPGCNEPEYNVVTMASFKIEEEQANVEIVLDRLPSERYKRNVVRGRLDLVVSMGGAAGLFVGASLLSFVEMFYFFSLRIADSGKQENVDNENSTTPKPTQQKESKINTIANIVQIPARNVLTKNPYPNNRLGFGYPPRGKSMIIHY